MVATLHMKSLLVAAISLLVVFNLMGCSNQEPNPEHGFNAGPRYSYVSFGSGACRATSPTDNPPSWYTTVVGFNGDLADCQAECTSAAECVAIEFKPGSSTHCELWSKEPQAATDSKEWKCLKKVEEEQSENGQAENFNFAHEGKDRTAELYMCGGCKDKPVPLVMAFPGTGQKLIHWNSFSKWHEEADQQKFAVLAFERARAEDENFDVQKKRLATVR
jgi:uncharacterized lipoprotein NlpE involved in copper resistance